MPIYEYECKSCGCKFESYRGLVSSDKDVKCPQCGSKDPRRVVSSFIGKGAGQSCGTKFSGG